jgi:hypothetical protein
MQVGFIKSETVLKLAAQCLGVVENLVLESEKKAAFDAFADVIRAALDEYETRMGRMVARVKPSNN